MEAREETQAMDVAEDGCTSDAIHTWREEEGVQEEGMEWDHLRRMKTEAMDVLDQLEKTMRNNDAKIHQHERKMNPQDPRITQRAWETSTEGIQDGSHPEDANEDVHPREKNREEKWTKEGNPSTSFERIKKTDAGSDAREELLEADETDVLISKLSEERDELQQQLEQLKREMHDVCDELGREIHASRELVQHTDSLKGSIDVLLREPDETRDDPNSMLQRANDRETGGRERNLDVADIIGRLTSRLDGELTGNDAPMLEGALERVLLAMGQKEEEGASIRVDDPSSETRNQEQHLPHEEELTQDQYKTVRMGPQAASPILETTRRPVISSHGETNHGVVPRALFWTLAVVGLGVLFFARTGEENVLPVS